MIIGLVALVVLILDIIALVDVFKSSMDDGKKVLWTILILVMPFVGMVLYFLLGQRK